MKKTFIILMLSLIMCGCASYKLEDTVWSTVSGAQNKGERGSVITSLIFKSSEDVDIYSSVVVDTSLVVTPFKYAQGKYVVSGNPRKEASIEINGSNIQNEKVSYKGVYHKNDAMLLISQDSIPYLYGMHKNVKIQ